MDNDKIITFEIPKGYKYRQRIFDKFVFERMNDRPTDIIEALEILDLSMLMEGNYRKEQLIALQQLLIFRDAWWKMADDWKPDWEEDDIKYCLRFMNNSITKNHSEVGSYVLAFPTAEMRDAFYDAFEELISEVKELL